MFRSVILPILTGLVLAIVFVIKGFLPYFSHYIPEADYLAGVSYSIFNVAIAVIGSMYFAFFTIILVFAWINRTSPLKSFISSFLAVGSAFAFFYLITLILQGFGVEHIHMSFRDNFPPWPSQANSFFYLHDYIFMVSLVILSLAIVCSLAVGIIQAQRHLKKLWVTIGLYVATYAGMLSIVWTQLGSHSVPIRTPWEAMGAGFVPNVLPNPIYEQIFAIVIITIVFAFGLLSEIRNNKNTSFNSI